MIVFTLLMIGCSSKQPIKSMSSTIIIKTPNMKYYDNGFIFYYEDYIKLQLLNIGKVVLDLEIYPHKICQSTFECVSSQDFNTEYLHSTYDNNFLYKLFQRKRINYRDKKNNILIKVK